MITQAIKTAGRDEEERVISAIVLAFAGDPLARWAFPDPQRYLKYFPQFVRALCGAAFAHQSAYYVENFAGAALWLPPGVHSDEEKLKSIVEEAVAPERMPRLYEVVEQMARFHPEAPHWYLAETGVDPSRQRSGYGAAMLRHALERVDEAHLPAFLESTNPRNLSLYERYGFKVTGKIEVETAPPVIPMLREAR